MYRPLHLLHFGVLFSFLVAFHSSSIGVARAAGGVEALPGYDQDLDLAVHSIWLSPAFRGKEVGRKAGENRE